MDNNIIRFITHQKSASVCCVDEQGNPYCFSCFYSLNSNEGFLYFKSSTGSRHAEIILKNPRIAGTILPDRLNLMQIKGIQFDGEILLHDQLLKKQASEIFYLQHPLALVMPGEIFIIQLNNIKMTANGRL